MTTTTNKLVIIIHTIIRVEGIFDISLHSSYLKIMETPVGIVSCFGRTYLLSFVKKN